MIGASVYIIYLMGVYVCGQKKESVLERLTYLFKHFKTELFWLRCSPIKLQHYRSDSAQLVGGYNWKRLMLS